MEEGARAEERSTRGTWMWASLRPTGGNRSVGSGESIQGKHLVRDEKAKGRMLGFICS